jgi:hypothetical protein
MAWPPIFGGFGRNVAALVRRQGKYTVALNGREYKEDFDLAFDPVFDRQGDRVLIRGVQDGKYHRHVVRTEDF